MDVRQAGNRIGFGDWEPGRQRRDLTRDSTRCGADSEGYDNLERFGQRLAVLAQIPANTAADCGEDDIGGRTLVNVANRS